MARYTFFDLWPFFSSSVPEENTGAVIRAAVCVLFAVSAWVFQADRNLWLQSSFVSGEGVGESWSWGLRPTPEPSFQMWGREAVAAVTSVAFCTCWPACDVVLVWDFAYLQQHRSVPYVQSMDSSSELLVCLPKHPADSVGDEMFLEHTGQHAQRVCVCVCLCVHSKAASLGALHQNARLCFCSCVVLQLLFLPRITLQVLSHFLLYVPLLLSALVSRPRLSRLSSPSNSLDSCQQACDWQSHSAGRASQPLPSLARLVIAMTTVRLSGLPCFLRVKPKSNLRVCFVGMTLGACRGVCNCAVNLYCILPFTYCFSSFKHTHTVSVTIFAPSLLEIW